MLINSLLISTFSNFSKAVSTTLLLISITLSPLLANLFLLLAFINSNTLFISIILIILNITISIQVLILFLSPSSFTIL